MRNLHFVGLSEDGSELVLASDTGEEFATPADDRLRAALRGDRARLGQLEIEMDSALRPRDIQARIRAGASPEDVAQAAQISVDKIMGYAVPVLAERRYIADRAQRSAVRRKGGDGPGRLLGECVAERLSDRGVDPAGAQWDAWRRDDGRWGVRVDYASGESQRSATFVYDAAGRYVLPDDDDARWLVGQQSSSHGPQPREPGQTRRLASVPDEGALLLDDEEQTADLTEHVAALREPLAEPAAEDDMAALADVISAAPAVEPAPVDAPAETGEPVAVGPADEEPADEEPAATPAPAAKRGARKERRKPSVPSWDEIMFGKGSAKE
jgi:hypothetical protein